jgi:hypothetical protein
LILRLKKKKRFDSGALVLKKPRLLDRDHCDPSKQLNQAEVIARVVAIAQAIAEKKFYPYQVELTSRIVESLLEHDGEVITGLMARQMGKTESLGAITAAIALILPFLAKKYPDDWRLNITDDQGAYRGLAQGVKIGIYGPRLEQADIIYQRVKKAFETDTGKQVMRELRVDFVVNNGGKVRLTNGSKIICESASEQSKIEGETHNLLICEESQDITDQKVKKSLHPMVSATMGTICKIGTATTQKCEFYEAIKHNKRIYSGGGKQNHFFYPYTVGEKYNSLYRQYIKGEKARLGEESDEFKTSYCGEWIFERGMFLTDAQLFHFDVAQTGGVFSLFYREGLPRQLSHYQLVAGIDWGEAFDSSVVTLLAVDYRNPIDSGYRFGAQGEEMGYFTYYQKHVVAWLEFQGDNYEYQFEHIMEWFRLFPQIRKIGMDKNGCGAPMVSRFEKIYNGSQVKIVPFDFSAKAKSDAYKDLYGDICGRRLTFPADPTVRRTPEYRKFVNQFQDLKKDYKNGLMTVAHPEEKGAHDDYCSSLLVANFAANEDTELELETFSSNPFMRRH